MIAFLQIVLRLLADLISVVMLTTKSRGSLEAEILVLRRQVALYRAKLRKIDAATRVSLAFLSRLCDWRSCLMVARPETVVRWHRAGWRLLWRYKSPLGRPQIPPALRQLCRCYAGAGLPNARDVA